jgi:hypothetical protein
MAKGFGEEIQAIRRSMLEQVDSYAILMIENVTKIVNETAPDTASRVIAVEMFKIIVDHVQEARSRIDLDIVQASIAMFDEYLKNQ